MVADPERIESDILCRRSHVPDLKPGNDSFYFWKLDTHPQRTTHPVHLRIFDVTIVDQQSFRFRWAGHHTVARGPVG
jgi:hypothetical protein